MRLVYLFTLLVLGFTSSNIVAQTDDNILWASINLTKSFENSNWSLKPIVRYDNDLSDYDNISIDISMSKSISKRWSYQLLARTWFIPSATNRQFFWTDIIYKKPFGDFSFVSSLRYHLAFDIKNRNDPDFIRWKTSVRYNKSSTIKPFLAVEPWFRLNDVGQWQRLRVEPGIVAVFNDQMNLSMTYRRESSLNLSPKSRFNVYVVNLTVKL